MAPTVEFSVVIPVFNESVLLLELHDRLSRVCAQTKRSYELLFIDDGSQDDSLAILRARQKGDKHLRVIQLAKNYGQQAAVLAGFRHSRGEVVVQLDSDLQHPPEEIPKLLEAMGPGVQLVTTRPHRRHDSPFRIAASWLAHTWTRKFQNKNWNLGSFRALRREVIERIERSEDRRYMAALMSQMNLNTREVDVAHHARVAGSTKYSWWTLVQLAASVPGMRWNPLAKFMRLPQPHYVVQNIYEPWT